MAFDDSQVPGQGVARDDSVEITFKAVDEGVHAGQIVGAVRRDPFRPMKLTPSHLTWELYAFRAPGSSGA